MTLETHLETYQQFTLEAQQVEAKKVLEVANLLEHLHSRLTGAASDFPEYEGVTVEAMCSTAFLVRAIYEADRYMIPTSLVMTGHVYGSGVPTVNRLVAAVIGRMKETHGDAEIAAVARALAEMLCTARTSKEVLVYDPKLLTEFVRHCRDGLVHLLGAT